jgi:hypothetical protein
MVEVGSRENIRYAQRKKFSLLSRYRFFTLGIYYFMKELHTKKHKKQANFSFLCYNYTINHIKSAFKQGI